MSLLADALDDDELRHALVDLRSARRKNRLQQLDKFDAFYKAYVSALLASVGLYAASGWFGDSPLSAGQLQRLHSIGPEWMGLLAAFIIAIGMRSGGRGGPMAFERADVRHLLLAPLDRRESIRKPALRQGRYMLFLGASAGAAIGIVASRRLPEHPIAWVTSAAVFGAALAVLSFGVAMICGGYRLRPWMTDVAAVAVAGWSVLDIVTGQTTSPLTMFGSLPLWPLQVNYTAFAGLMVAGVLAVWGLGVVNRSSIEAAERRSRLVGQLRFAATLQDVRTVMVLQRQLAQEQTRQKPWIRLPASRRAGVKDGRVAMSVFLRRGLVGMLRWPILRLVRLLFFTAVATAAGFGVWMGTGALVVVAGLAMWLAALDLCEPLAQEVDHPDRLHSTSQQTGRVYTQLVILPLLVLFWLVVLGSIPVFVLGDPGLVVALWPLGVFIAFTALSGAVLTVNARPPSSSGVAETPETASLKFAWRVLVPPGVAISGFVPVLVAERSWQRSHDVALVLSDTNVASGICIALSFLSMAWLRYGDQFRENMQAAAVPAAGDEKADAKKAGKPDADKVKGGSAKSPVVKGQTGKNANTKSSGSTNSRSSSKKGSKKKR